MLINFEKEFEVVEMRMRAPNASWVLPFSSNKNQQITQQNLSLIFQFIFIIIIIIIIISLWNLRLDRYRLLLSLDKETWRDTKVMVW